MTIDMHSVTATIRELGIELLVEAVDLSMDESRIPYATARLVCAMPSAEDRDAIDLRDGDLHVDAVLRRDFGRPWSLADLTAAGGGAMAGITSILAGGPLANITHMLFRPWNSFGERQAQRRDLRLLITERVFDDVAKTLTVTAQSLEAHLRGDALLETTAWDPGATDLATICALVLDRYGLALTSSTTATVAEVDATLWQPGVTADKYLEPMLEAASLRLWSNEVGEFALSERQSTTPGAVTVTATGTMTEHRDTMTRTDPDVSPDGVAIRYRWVDAFDLNRTEYDVAGPQPARSVLFLERTTAYPGPGAAAGILNRAAARGRVLDVAAVSDYSIAPGQACTVTPPDTPAQTGYVSAVEWRLPGAEMNVATRGLVDTPETSWLYAPEGVSWLDVDAGISWIEYEPELIGA